MEVHEHFIAAKLLLLSFIVLHVLTLFYTHDDQVTTGNGDDE